jgi:hypothetical protein
MELPPLELVQTFERLIPGFIRDPRKIEIAQMMWATLDPSRRHRSVEGAFWFPTGELRCLFGEVRNFSNAKGRLKMVKLSAWRAELKAKEMGKMRQEGKTYVVKDGDVFHFRFNV